MSQGSWRLHWAVEEGRLVRRWWGPLGQAAEPGRSPLPPPVAAPGPPGGHDPSWLVAPMAGRIVAASIEEGGRVSLAVEGMKLRMPLRGEGPGPWRLLVALGEEVRVGQRLAQRGPEGPPAATG